MIRRWSSKKKFAAIYLSCVALNERPDALAVRHLRRFISGGGGNQRRESNCRAIADQVSSIYHYHLPSSRLETKQTLPSSDLTHKTKKSIIPKQNTKEKVMGNSSSKTPAFTPLPDRKPQVSAAQAAVPRDFHDIPERVLIHTTLGDITVGLFREQTPRVSHHVVHIVDCLAGRRPTSQIPVYIHDTLPILHISEQKKERRTPSACQPKSPP